MGEKKKKLRRLEIYWMALMPFVTALVRSLVLSASSIRPQTFGLLLRIVRRRCDGREALWFLLVADQYGTDCFSEAPTGIDFVETFTGFTADML